MSRPLVYAHRGASAFAFENTMTAFRLAEKMGTDGLEFDLQLTKDRVPVVIHDRQLKRLAGKNGSIDELLFSEVKKIRIGKPFLRKYRFHSIPTFQEVWDFALEHDLKLNIELKETFQNDSESLHDVCKIVSQRPRNDVHISSFHYEVIEWIKQHFPEIETAFIATKNIRPEEILNFPAADAIHLNKRFFSNKWTEELLKHQKKFRLYNVTGKEVLVQNPPSVIEGWITNYPNRF